MPDPNPNPNPNPSPNPNPNPDPNPNPNPTQDDAPPAATESTAAPRKKPPSRDDTWTYLQTLQEHDWDAKIEAATALKQLAFDADASYKDGLIRGGVLCLLMTMLKEAPAEFRSTKAIEQACSCMYPMNPDL